jgi:hypothetical protein
MRWLQTVLDIEVIRMRVDEMITTVKDKYGIISGETGT